MASLVSFNADNTPWKVESGLISGVVHQSYTFKVLLKLLGHGHELENDKLMEHMHLCTVAALNIEPRQSLYQQVSLIAERCFLRGSLCL
jgi:hypothetical protein